MFQRSPSFDPNTWLFSTMIEKDHNGYTFIMNIIIPRINCANEDILDLCDSCVVAKYEPFMSRYTFCKCLNAMPKAMIF